MHEYLCSTTAFRLHRTPPQVLALCPSFPDLDIRSTRRQLNNESEQLQRIGLPLHVLSTDKHHRRNTNCITMHLWSGELPCGAFIENELDITVASPAFTLLTMAPHVSDIHLLMAAYELCGEFAVYRPSPDMQRELDRLSSSGALNPRAAWRQVMTADGGTSLWRRPALIEIDELIAFARAAQGMRGQRKLLWAAERVSGITYSPLEVQASIKLGLSRRYGGEGFGPFSNNQRIALGPDARRLAEQDTCYADIYFEQTDARGPLDIECHGHMVHDGLAKSGLDANRTTALQSMGIDVVLLTQEQMTSAARWAAAAELIASKLGTSRRPKTEALQAKERELNRQLFIDWQTLGA